MYKAGFDALESDEEQIAWLDRMKKLHKVQEQVKAPTNYSLTLTTLYSAAWNPLQGLGMEGNTGS